MNQQQRISADQIDKKVMLVISGEDFQTLYDQIIELPISRKMTNKIVNILENRVYTLDTYSKAIQDRKEDTLKSFIKNEPTLIEKMMQEDLNEGKGKNEEDTETEQDTEETDTSNGKIKGKKK